MYDRYISQIGLVSKVEEIDEIGAIARELDNKMTVSERMKLKKSVLRKLVIALLIYAGTMGFMNLFL